MKRIYLLMAAVVGLTSAASAQRMIDVTVQHFYVLGDNAPTGLPSEAITDGTHILFDADMNNKIFCAYTITNNGVGAADSIMLTDTVHLDAAVGSGILGTGLHIDAQGTSFVFWPATQWPAAIGPNTDPGGPWDDFVSKPVTVDWCDSVFFTSPNGSANPVNETGKTANNITCNSVVIDGWMTGVPNLVIGGNGLNVYPNPSNGQLNVSYDFGNNNSGVITIVDVTGKIVYTQQLDANLRGLQTIKVNANGLANGLYTLRLASGNKFAVDKIYINN